MTTPTDPPAALKLARDALKDIRASGKLDEAEWRRASAALAAIDALPAPSGEPVAEIDREGVLWLNTNPHRLPIGTKLYAGATSQAAPAPQAEPVATLWQHCETGRTRVTMPDQVWTQDATWDIVGPLYLHPSQGAANSQAILDGSSAEPVATLHDDGCFTWKRDEFRRKYDRQRAGWRMDVYAQPAPAVAAPVQPLTDDAKDAARYRFWRAAYTHADRGDAIPDALMALSDAWTPDEVDAVIDAAAGITAPTAPTDTKE